MKQKRIAVIYDWIDKWGGVERILLNLHSLFPDAVFYTSYVDRQKAHWANAINIQTSFIQHFPGFVKNNRILSLPLYPFAFESFHFKDVDLVISVTSSFAKGIIVKPDVPHICYLLTPTRFLWTQQQNYLNNSFIKAVSTPYMSYLRKWDYLAAQRPDRIVSISRAVAERCKKYYRRNSEVIYPPFDIDYWESVEKRAVKTDSPLKNGIKDYFLIVSRLESYKRIDLAVEAFNAMKDKRLVIVGKGSQSGLLKEKAKENIIFLDQVSDEELALLYTNAHALIMPQEEDFGYVALEAQFFGCPVVAFRRGGALETVAEGKTGVFIEHQTPQSMTQALALFHTLSYNNRVIDRSEIKKRLAQFSKNTFEQQFKSLISSYVD